MNRITINLQIVFYHLTVLWGVFAFLEVYMDYMSISEAAAKWNVSNRRVQVLCNTERIPGACRIGNIWAIPKNAEKPHDARIRSGKYCKEMK